MSAEWEYKAFVYRWKPDETWMLLDAPGSVVAARLFFWQEYQAIIMPKLQEWLDAGWEPVGEVGASAIRTREYKSLAKGAGCLAWFMIICVALSTFGFGLLLMRSWYSEPTEFRVTMRRHLPQTE